MNVSPQLPESPKTIAMVIRRNDQAKHVSLTDKAEVTRDDIGYSHLDATFATVDIPSQENCVMSVVFHIT